MIGGGLLGPGFVVLVILNLVLMVVTSAFVNVDYEDEHCFVSAQGESDELPSWLCNTPLEPFATTVVEGFGGGGFFGSINSLYKALSSVVAVAIGLAGLDYAILQSDNTIFQFLGFVVSLMGWLIALGIIGNLALPLLGRLIPGIR